VAFSMGIAIIFFSNKHKQTQLQTLYSSFLKKAGTWGGVECAALAPC
jgi:hypothetical protein